MYPNRIDLEVGSAPENDPFKTAAIRYGSTIGPERFPNMLLDLQALLNDTPPDDARPRVRQSICHC